MVRARIAIVPCDEQKPSSCDLKVAVFDRSILVRRHHSLVPWAELEHRPLVFKAANRPRKRYLYSAFLLTLLRRRRYECTDRNHDLARHGKGEPWGSPEKLPPGVTMGMVARRIRHVLNHETVLGRSDVPLTSGVDGPRR